MDYPQELRNKYVDAYVNLSTTIWRLVDARYLGADSQNPRLQANILFLEQKRDALKWEAQKAHQALVEAEQIYWETIDKSSEP